VVREISTAAYRSGMFPATAKRFRDSAVEVPAEGSCLAGGVTVIGLLRPYVSARKDTRKFLVGYPRSESSCIWKTEFLQEVKFLYIEWTTGALNMPTILRKYEFQFYFYANAGSPLERAMSTWRRQRKTPRCGSNRSLRSRLRVAFLQRSSLPSPIARD
jgi:hypothetical protein